MEIKTFEGKFRDIGRQEGKIYKKNGLTLDWGSIKDESRLLAGQLKVYEKYYPEMLEEVKGIAEGGGFNEEKAIYNFITSEIFWYTDRFSLKRECTIFGVRNKNGFFVGRNYDWHPAIEKLWEIYKVKSPGLYPLIAVTDMATAPKKDAVKTFYYADDAINSKGLFIGLTFAYNDKWSFGISNLHMCRFIAERCKNVKEAIGVFKEVPICCSKNYFIADKEGNMAVVEHSSRKFKVLEPQNGVLIQTNHYIDPGLAKEDTVLKNAPSHNTFLRYYETLQKINLIKETFSFPDIVKILGFKSYIYQNSPDIKTIWSLGLDMKNRDYKICWNLQKEKKEKILKI